MQAERSTTPESQPPTLAPASLDGRHLKPTPLLDYQHPSIQELVRTRNWATGDENCRIAAIYTYVRDEIPFGYNTSDNLPAVAVLADGYGQCNTKTTLLMALLRAAGIPTRFHGATIHKRLQRGVIDGLFYRLAPASIVHSWAEVSFDGRWVALEGVILDQPYLDGIRLQFPEQSATFLGYGVGTDNLANPPIDWRGTDTAIQATGINQDYGIFDDPDTFYRQHGANLSGLRAQLYSRWVRRIMNRNVNAVRTRRANVPLGPTPQDDKL